MGFITTIEVAHNLKWSILWEETVLPFVALLLRTNLTESCQNLEFNGRELLIKACSISQRLSHLYLLGRDCIEDTQL